MNHRSNLLSTGAVAVILAGLLAGCGSTQFGGRSEASGTGRFSKKANDSSSSDATPQTGDSTGGGGSTDSPTEAKSLAWNLECEGTTASGTTPVDAAIDGGGAFTTSGGSSYNIAFKGRHCEGVTPKKDVLFLFDGSNSMSNNDPLVNDSCGRLDTMKAIMQSFSGGTGNRFGLVSFSSGNQSTITSSGKFFDSDTDLIGALETAKGKPVSEVVCDSNRLGTNYDTGFAAAESLIQLDAAVDAGTIVFFVSDGKPLFGQTGEAVASRLKASGVLIATVMVKGDETVMRDRIASRDGKNQPLHIKVQDISQLTNAISQLASRTIVPDVLRYRAVNTEAWTAINLYPTATSTNWQMQEVSFDKNAYPDGVEVEYLYFMPDTTGRGSLQGTLMFDP
jgi:hypothetical protein